VITEQQRQLFAETVWEHYRQHGRKGLPWRQPEPDGTFDAYKIMVSEAMLQQTQVPRVVPKFKQFLALFPDVQTLAMAPLSTVLVAWNGLGYNRRAKFLWQAAQNIVTEHGGQPPQDPALLQKLPGIGPNTAAAIAAYVYNWPVIFVETNIRTVFIHHFFADTVPVPDKAILAFVRATLDREHPREWYWALMDYGTHLKQTVGNLTRNSQSYARQSKFEGSLRQIRGAVIRLLAESPQSASQLAARIGDKRLAAVLSDLKQEHLIQQAAGRYRLPGP